jgi:hypothetical protein
VAARTGTFNVRADKVPPPLLHKFGWCTWDAFYSSVRPEGVLAGLKGLALGGVPAKFLILDDGWQSVGNPAGRGRGRGGKAAAAAGAARVEAAAAEVGASRSGSTNSSTSSSATSASSTTATTTTTTTSSSSSSSAEATNLSGTTLTGNVGATLAVEVSNPVAAWLTAACGAFYANHVEHAPPGAWTVKLWSFLVRRTLLRASLLQFFDTFTDFSKRLTSFRANAKFERPSAAQGGLPGDPGATFKAFVRAAKQGSHSNASPSSSGSNGVDLVSVCLPHARAHDQPQLIYFLKSTSVYLRSFPPSPLPYFYFSFFFISKALTLRVCVCVLVVVCGVGGGGVCRCTAGTRCRATGAASASTRPP